MAGNSMDRVRVAAAILASVGVLLGVASVPARSEGVPVYAESTADALARNVRILATSPRNFDALLGAGKAALELGDEQAAAGFFGRAEEVNPNSPLAHAGMGAALVATGDARGSLAHFARAQQLGASVAAFGCDRGLAYDLLGLHAQAQSDYEAALLGRDRDEARRRLALSQAISGKKDVALLTVQPLLQRGDVAAGRVRSLILALAGDVTGAKAVLDATVPGMSGRMDPFFRRLPHLASRDKAFAVHLGIFPDPGGHASATTGYGNAAPPQDTARLASIPQLLNSQPQPPVPQPQQVAQQRQPAEKRAAPVPQQRIVTQLASASLPKVETARSSSNGSIETVRVQSTPGAKKIWLQLASGPNAESLPNEYKRIRSRSPELFETVSPYVAEDGPRARLVIGPFHTRQDAELFEEALQSARINAFSWTSSPAHSVRKLSYE